MPRVSILRLPALFSRRVRRNRMTTLAVLAVVAIVLIIPLYSLYCIYKPPHFLIGYMRAKYPDVLFEEPSVKQRMMALSFDDAPSSYTRDIAKVLLEHEVHATFFVIGSQVDSNGAEGPKILRELVAAGHELGNHAMHDEPSHKLSNEELEKQVNEVKQKLVAAYTAENKILPNNYFRPGSGFFNHRMRDLLGNRGFRITLGSVYPHDPQLPYPDVNAKHIQSMAHPGAIIICHDRRKWTVPMLQKLIPALKADGYKLVTITDLVKAVEPIDGRRPVASLKDASG
ncbi:Putative Carbohydrate esterase family 4 [[Torrubiella] hemipterigena]|uniref:chitin deacetylase n=1 Tax=[Torrubiella] hemipterigena TaxID=1531966 RepID=A0A0A1T6Z9_9HYPO|nr:Putative Carbohydrate esterase family 4 [[Torrubiella] hemipterigena]